MIKNITESGMIQAALHFAEGRRANQGLEVLLIDPPVRRALATAVQVAYDGKPGDDFPEQYADAADELWQFFVPARQESPPEKVV